MFRNKFSDNKKLWHKESDFFCQTKNYKKLWKTKKRQKKIGTKTCEKLNGDKHLWHLFAKQIIYLQNQYIKNKKKQQQKCDKYFSKKNVLNKNVEKNMLTK